MVVSVKPEAVITVRVCFFLGEAAADTKYGLTSCLLLLPPPEVTLLLLRCWDFEGEAGPVVEGVQRQRASSRSAEIASAALPFPFVLLPPTTVTSPGAAPLTTACSHLTALFFREVMRADDLLGLLAPASACILVKGLDGDMAADVVAAMLDVGELA